MAWTISDTSEQCRSGVIEAFVSVARRPKRPKVGGSRDARGTDQAQRRACGGQGERDELNDARRARPALRAAARRVLDAWQAQNQSTADVGASAVLREALVQVEQVLDDLAVLTLSTTNDAVRLGAIKARAETVDRRTEILHALGRLGRLRVNEP
jgi:hypothetical protein